MGAPGLKGEVKAKVFTATPDALPRYGVLHTQDGPQFKITRLSPRQRGRGGDCV